VRTHVNFEPAELFSRLLALRPAAFVLFHNHPSGVLTPSAEDLLLTRRVAKLAASFGIELVGHWIVSPTGERWITVPINDR
jgi:DNA repair protein RadC